MIIKQFNSTCQLKTMFNRNGILVTLRHFHRHEAQSRLTGNGCLRGEFCSTFLPFYYGLERHEKIQVRPVSNQDWKNGENSKLKHNVSSLLLRNQIKYEFYFN